MHPGQAKERVRVFVNHEAVELEGDRIRVKELLEIASFQGNEWDLMRLDRKDDLSGGTPVDLDTFLELRPEEHFRVIPGNRTYG